MYNGQQKEPLSVIKKQHQKKMAWIPSTPLNIGHEIFANATFYIAIHIMGDINILLAIVQQPLLQLFAVWLTTN